MTHLDTNPLKQLALSTLSTLHEENKRYDEANRVIRQIEPEFPATMFPINDTCSASVVRLVDAILGDEIGSYFLYEATNMKDGGKIIEVDGTEYPIRNIEDVKAYVLRSAT